MSATKRRFVAVDEYIASCPEPVRERLEAVRDEAPTAEEAIKDQMPSYVLHGNLVHVAAWKEHIAAYPISAVMEASIAELAPYPASGKGTVQFPHARPWPLELVRRIVAMRVAENRANAGRAHP